MLFEKNQLDVKLLRSRFSELQSLCDKLEALGGDSEDSGQEIGITILRLEDLFRKIDANTRYSKVKATFNVLGITPEENYVLSFVDGKELVKKARSGDRDSIARLIIAIRSSISSWDKRLLSISEASRDAGVESQLPTNRAAKEETTEKDVEASHQLGISLTESMCGIRRSDIILILGAGASRPLGLPTMKEFWNWIQTVAEKGTYDARDALRKIKEAHNLEHVDGPPDLEQLLFLLERYGLYYDIMFDDPVFGFEQGQIWDYTFSPYSGKTFKKFIEKHLQYDVWYSTGVRKLKDYLESLLIQVYWPKFESGRDKEKIVNLFAPLTNLILNDLGQSFVPIFTTNYDPVIESYCEFSNTQLEYGFERIGARNRWNRARFANYAPAQAKQNILLFKLHGSLSWRREGGNIFDYALSLECGPGAFAVIYPAETKEYPYDVSAPVK